MSWSSRRRWRRVRHILAAPFDFVCWLLWPDPLTLGLAWLCFAVMLVLLAIVVWHAFVVGAF